MANAIRVKSFEFAVRVIGASKELQLEHREYVLSKQLLRAGTAIGALVREAQHAANRPDFIHKLSIALKEANETAYWLELLREAGYLHANRFDELSRGIYELLRLLTAIIKSTKGLRMDRRLRGARPSQSS